jgi:hypothetical protein
MTSSWFNYRCLSQSPFNAEFAQSAEITEALMRASARAGPNQTTLIGRESFAIVTTWTHTHFSSK